MREKLKTLIYIGTDAERLALTTNISELTRYYAMDIDRYYLWNGTQWITINGGGTGGMVQHGNEWHTPDFAEAGSGGGGGNLDGGLPDSNYGGITPIDGGIP